jgi:Lamin Tail Domain
MTYTLLAGEFVIRYPDLPRSGPEPDGDTMKFAPDTPALVEALPRLSGRAPDLNARGISVRLEAIDALETHFAETHQELAGANAARDDLLDRAGFRNITFWPDLPNKVQSADQDRLRGHVLSNGVDANGRMIAFVYPGDAADPDGAEVFLDEARLKQSLNARLLAAGHAYPVFYATLPADLRARCAALSRAARGGQPAPGLWPRSTADPNGPATVPDLGALEQLVIWPKLFRRIVPYLAAGFPDFDGFDTWLRADPVDRDDRLFLLDRLESGNLHDVIRANGDTIQLTVWPEDFIIDPDPAPPGAGPPPQPPAVAVADVLIIAALPDPAGVDPGSESVTLLNTTAAAVDLTGWAITDTAGGRQPLTGTLQAGATQRIQLTPAVQLSNQGDSIRITDPQGRAIDQVAYQPNQVRPGRTIAFNR